MILVTGGTGLLGAHLMYELVNDKKKVRAIIRPSSNLDQVRKTFSYYTDNSEELFAAIEWVEADITDPVALTEAMKEVQQVYHTAAFVSFDPKDHAEMLRINIESTTNIVNRCLEKNDVQCCFVSSTAALGASVYGEEVTEDRLWTDLKRRSVYSISKFKSEMEIWRGITEGLQAVIINPSVIIGPGNWQRSSSRLFSTVWKGLNYYTKGGTGYVDVRDVVKSMIMVMNGKHWGERFIVSGENLTYKSVFNMIARSLQKSSPGKLATPFLAGLAWRLDWLKSMLTGKERVITKETAQAGQKLTQFSNHKIISATGIQFIPIEQSIRETAKLFLSEQAKA